MSVGIHLIFSRHGCSPVSLFDAPVEKYCPDNFIDIKVGLLVSLLSINEKETPYFLLDV